MNEPKLLYKNNRLLAMNFVTLVTIAMPVFVYYMVITNYDSHKAEFTSTFTFMAFLAFVFLSTHIMLGVILWMHQRYVLRIVQIDEVQITIKTWSIIGLHRTRTYPIDIINQAQYQHGKGYYGRGLSVNAPWLKLKTPENKTLVLDLQAEIYF